MIVERCTTVRSARIFQCILCDFTYLIILGVHLLADANLVAGKLKRFDFYVIIYVYWPILCRKNSLAVKWLFFISTVFCIYLSVTRPKCCHPSYDFIIKY
jgi:hypothetical protein